MNQDEIKREIDCKSACQTALLGFAREYELDIAKLEAQLTEAEKPVFKDGDDGLAIQKRGADSGVCSFIFVGGSVYYNTGTYDEETALSDSRFYDYVRLSNIFDHLKALSRPLHNFTADVHPYSFDFKSFPQAPIQIAGNWHTLEKAKQISMDIQRLIFTAEKEASGE